MSKRLFTAGLHFEADHEELKRHFQQVGKVTDVYLPAPQPPSSAGSRVNRGFGFVEMASEEEATRAIEQLNDRPGPRGRPITVTYAQGKTRKDEPR